MDRYIYIHITAKISPGASYPSKTPSLANRFSGELPPPPSGARNGLTLGKGISLRGLL